MERYAIELQDLSVWYGEVQALEKISLKVKEGDYLAIMGPNGGGKSTLLKAILGLQEVKDGSIRLFGGTVRQNRNKIGYVPQIWTMDKDFPITVMEVVLTGRLPRGLRLFHRYDRRDRDLALEMLGKVGLADLAGRKISQLSGGQFQKMMIARALMTHPKLLLLDEPTASVDAASSQDIYELLGELNREMTILLVTHNVLAISTYVGALACLNSSLVYHGEPTLTRDVVDKMYGCPVEIVAHGVPHRVLDEHEGKGGAR